MNRMDDMRRLLFRRGFSDKLYWYNFRTVWMFVAACFVLNALSGYLGVKIGRASCRERVYRLV